MAGMCISLTAVQQWLRNEALRQKITDEVLSGKKKMCLAVTEAFAGSDVAGLRTTAKKTPDGKHYIVNGTKYAYLQSFSSKVHELTTIPGNGSPMACSATTLSLAAEPKRVSRCS